MIFKDDQVLLVRRARDPYRDCWELPGGFSDRGEHPAETARREIREELGVPVQLTAVLGFYLDAYLDDIAEVVTFLGEIDGEPSPNPAEISEHGWFVEDELPSDTELVPGHADRLRDWSRVRRGEASLGLGLSRT